MSRTLMPASNFGEALAQSLDALRAGAAVTECLAFYPEYADELAPLLKIVETMSETEWPRLSPGSRARGRARMHEALSRRRPGNWLQPAWSFAGMALILIVLAIGVWLSWPGRDDNRQIAQPTVTLAAPELTATATATSTPTATREPPTSRPTEIEEPEEGEEPEEPIMASRPAETAEPTKTPRPAETAEPTKTPRPKETEKPKATKTSVSPRTVSYRLWGIRGLP